MSMVATISDKVSLPVSFQHKWHKEYISAVTNICSLVLTSFVNTKLETAWIRAKKNQGCHQSISFIHLCVWWRFWSGFELSQYFINKCIRLRSLLPDRSGLVCTVVPKEQEFEISFGDQQKKNCTWDHRVAARSITPHLPVTDALCIKLFWPN